MKHWKARLSAVLAAALLTVSCGGYAGAADTPRGPLALADIEALGARAHIRDDLVAFIDGPCTDAPVLSMDDAAKVVDSMIPLLGGDERTQFEPWRTLQDTCGNQYYVFQQMYADTTVLGGTVKLVANPEGVMLGLVSSVKSELPDIEASEGISPEEAEALVLEHLADKGQDAAQLLKGRTDKALLPLLLHPDMTDADIDVSTRFVWVVYTTNPTGSQSGGSEPPYLAHYVSMSGEYLYDLPTLMPGDQASARGYGSDYVFQFMEPVEYTGSVKLSNGTEQEISVTIMRDKRTGMYYLGNIERRIAVADCYEFLYNDGNILMEGSTKNADWDETCLLSLYNYCRAWDYYHEIGWNGGDGLETPILILKDYCNIDHVPQDNAGYAGHFFGWQAFASSSINDFSQCLDVIAHEFTHCVTGSLMTYNPYFNDFGAINEAMSDIQGNVCEMMLGATEDTAWNLGENSQIGPMRSMSAPEAYRQPRFTWDLRYVPNVKTPTTFNDRGGVHDNSSLLNNIAYRLCTDGGMTLEEARAFWFAVGCAMVPGSDHPHMAELMPWVLKILGMERYMTPLEAAMDATRIRSNDVPDTFDDDRALVTLTLPEEERFMDGHWRLYVISVDTDGFARRFMDILGGEGEYATALDDIAAALSGDGAQAGADSGPLTRLLGVCAGYFADLVSMGSSFACQDGRTVRMVSRPGMTLPILARLEIDSEMRTQSLALTVYAMGQWIDLGALVGPSLSEALAASGDEGSPGAEDALLNWLIGLLRDVRSDSSGGKLTSILDAVKQLADLRDLSKRLFLRIEGGGVCEIPATGLEMTATLTAEEYPALIDLLNKLVNAQPSEEVEASDQAGESQAGES